MFVALAEFVALDLASTGPYSGTNIHQSFQSTQMFFPVHIVLCHRSINERALDSLAAPGCIREQYTLKNMDRPQKKFCTDQNSLRLWGGIFCKHELAGKLPLRVIELLNWHNDDPRRRDNYHSGLLAFVGISGNNNDIVNRTPDWVKLSGEPQKFTNMRSHER